MGKQILVVDDSAMVRRQVRMALEASFEVVEAVDGAEGVKEIESNDQLAAVICDVNMPNMDGIELLTEVRPKERALPIVMLTTEGQPDMIRRAKEAGAKGWIVKPFKPELLLAAVHKLTA